VTVKKTACKKNKVTIFPITQKGHALALGLADIADEVLVYRPGELRGGRLGGLVAKAFKSSVAIVFVGAAGIAVRAIAPLLRGKDKDPAVVVMDEKARFVVSLLSGHLGGANRLAEEIADKLQATPVVTTATDVNNLPCIEDVALKFNMAVENVRAIKALNSAILAGGPVLIIDKNQKRLSDIRAFLLKRGAGVFLFRRTMPAGKDARAVAIISNFTNVTFPEAQVGCALILRPREFVAGVGCRRGTSEADIRAAVDDVFRRQGISTLCLRNLATIDIKGDEEGLLEFARSRGLELELFSATELNKKAVRSSSFVMSATGARGVSEPAAIISSGAKRLWIKKQKTARVTVALARVSYTS